MLGSTLVIANISDGENVIVGANNTQNITTIVHNYYRQPNQQVDEDALKQHIRRYLQWVRSYYGKITLRGLKRGPVDLPLDEIYVPLTAGVRRRGRAEEPRAIEMDQLLGLGRRLVVTGGPGCGKTTVLQHVACTLATALLEDDATFARQRLGLTLAPDEALPLPIFAPIGVYGAHLRQYRADRAKRTLTQFLSEYLIGCEGVPNLPGDFFSRLLATGRGVFLLLDGLDEVPDEDDRALVRAQIESLFAGAEKQRLRESSPAGPRRTEIRRLWVGVSMRCRYSR